MISRRSSIVFILALYHLIAMLQSVMAVTTWCPRGLVTIMVSRMTISTPNTPIAVKTPIHVAVEILKLFERF